MVKTTLGIDGMACSMCESHVNEAIRSVIAAKKVVSSHQRARAEIISEAAPDESALRAAVEKTGYHVTSYSVEPYEKKGLFGLLKK